MTRTQYYVANQFRVPFFCGPDELGILGQWVTADVPLAGIRDFLGE